MIEAGMIARELLDRGIARRLAVLAPAQLCDQWERESAGEKLRSMLRNGSDVLVHCRGGLGRAGTIAARLLVELGEEPLTAIAKVREVRPGAIENSAQEEFVMKIDPV